MKITVNNADLETQAGTLQDLLRELSMLEKTGIAVAVNERVVQRSKWDQQLINERDEILVITAAAGG